MKNIHNFFLIAVVILAGCHRNEKPFLVKQGDISLILPGFVSEDELAEDALVEYANRYRNFYVVVHHFKTIKDKNTLWEQNTRRITKVLKSFKIDTSIQENIILTEIKGNFEGEKEPIIYHQKLIYKVGDSYLLTIWTRGNERYKKHQPTISEIIESFKLEK